eukprot:1196058-Prorocentrum_minimum.AAC.8
MAYIHGRTGSCKLEGVSTFWGLALYPPRSARRQTLRPQDSALTDNGAACTNQLTWTRRGESGHRRGSRTRESYPHPKQGIPPEAPDGARGETGNPAQGSRRFGGGQLHLKQGTPPETPNGWRGEAGKLHPKAGRATCSSPVVDADGGLRRVLARDSAAGDGGVAREDSVADGEGGAKGGHAPPAPEAAHGVPSDVTLVELPVPPRPRVHVHAPSLFAYTNQRAPQTLTAF